MSLFQTSSLSVGKSVCNCSCQQAKSANYGRRSWQRIFWVKTILVNDKYAISEFLCVSVSKRVYVRNHYYENDLDLHENETTCRTHFHMKGFALRRFETQAQGNPEMAINLLPGTWRFGPANKELL